MKNEERPSFRQKIMETNAYKSWIPVLQKIAMSRNNINHVKHGFTVAGNIGYKKWESQCGFNQRNKDLIKELLENEIRPMENKNSA